MPQFWLEDWETPGQLIDILTLPVKRFLRMPEPCWSLLKQNCAWPVMPAGRVRGI